MSDGNLFNDAAAAVTIEAYINEVKAQRDKKIAESDADELVHDALSIIDLLEDGLLG
jgi:hypothetical protein